MAPRLNHLAEPSSNSGSKRKAARFPQSTGKRSMAKIANPKLDVTVYTMFYASRMFAVNFAVNHLLDLVAVDLVLWSVIGDYSLFNVRTSTLFEISHDSPWAIGSKHGRIRPDEEHNLSTITVDDVDIVLHTSYEGVTHYGLEGRVINVFLATTSKKLADEYPAAEEDVEG
ncbi:hypothetical protein DFH29DRAFT_1005763 [Suillus ampliporus]|nr:hypothetical protein DFH29DRAFT_1005763 [Suillus ampliporus]